MILIPSRKLIVPRPPVMAHRVRGYYRMQVLGPNRKLRQDTGWFPNLITNQGLDYMGNSNSYLTECMVGTGNSTPAYTDTTLNAQVAAVFNSAPQSPNNGSGGTSPNFFSYLNMPYSFGQGVAAGNLQEIGIGPDGTHCFSRALIVNSSGVPTTLTILSNEYLNVTYQIQLWNPTNDVSGTVNIGGTNYNYTMRAANACTSGWGFGNFGSYPHAFGLNGVQVFNDTVLQPITSQPVGTQQGTNDNGTALNSYVPGTYYVDGTASFSFSQCNGGANNSALVTFGSPYGGMGEAQIIFGGTIPKTSAQIMTLSFRQTWARH